MIAAGTSQLLSQEAVPYLNDPLLDSPVQRRVIDSTTVYLECDWQTLLSMIHDLEERIAGALEVDTVYGNYFDAEVIEALEYRSYDCYKLRDSVLLLQFELEEALVGPPTLLVNAVEGISQTLATVTAEIVDDGGAPLRTWGVIFGKYDWWVDSLSMFNFDSLETLWANGEYPAASDLDGLMDSGLASSVSPIFPTPGSMPSSPIPAVAMDTSVLDSGRFETALSGLERYTRYMVLTLAANDSLMDVDLTSMEGIWGLHEGRFILAGANGAYEFGADTISFWTLPDLASGLLLDTTEVTSHSANLFLTMTDAGGQGPDRVVFKWSDQDFVTGVNQVDSLATDSLPGLSHGVSLDGLNRYTTYYFNAGVENLAGQVFAPANLSFRTLPEVPELEITTASDSLIAGQVLDLGGDNGSPIPDQVKVIWSLASDLSDPQSSVVSYVQSDSTFEKTLSGLTAGAQYYTLAAASNVAGWGQSDTLSFATRIGLTTATTPVALRSDSMVVAAELDFYNISPDALGFRWSEDGDLVGQADAIYTGSLATSGTKQQGIGGLNRYTDYSFMAFAVQSGDTIAGDTVVFRTRAEAIQFGGVEWNEADSSLTWKVADLGGDEGLPIPSTPKIAWGGESNLSDAGTPEAATYEQSDSTFSIQLDAFNAGRQYYTVGYASNVSGASDDAVEHASDTLSFATLVGVSTNASYDVTANSATFSGCFDFVDAIDSVGFVVNKTASGAQVELLMQSMANANLSSCDSIEFDGYTYPLVGIGSQCWFGQNLRATNYLNGLPIDGNLSDSEWNSTNSGAFAAYSNDPSIAADQGMLYNWFAVNEGSGLCPAGWHVPSNAEWLALVNEAGGAAEAGLKLKAGDQDEVSWTGNNELGFGITGSGYRSETGGYGGLGIETIYWTATSAGATESNRWTFWHDSDGAFDGTKENHWGLAVRCLRDEPYFACDNQLMDVASGLERYTEYAVRGVASNASGMSFGDSIYFRTLPEVPELDTLQWNPQTEFLAGTFTDIGGPLPDSIFFTWNSLAPPADSMYSAASIALADSSFGFSLADLIEPGTRYQAQGFASNEAGIGSSDTLDFASFVEWVDGQSGVRELAQVVKMDAPSEENNSKWGNHVAVSSAGDLMAFAGENDDIAIMKFFEAGVISGNDEWGRVGSVPANGTLQQLALSGDGNRLLVKINGFLKVYEGQLVGEGPGMNWNELPVLPIGPDNFMAIAVSASGMRVAVGLPATAQSTAGRVLVFDYISGTWTQVVELLGEYENAYLGQSLDISGDGTYLAIGSKRAWADPVDGEEYEGRVIVFHDNGGVWEQHGNALTGSMEFYGGSSQSYFGDAVRISDDGNTLVEGSHSRIQNHFGNTGGLNVFHLESGTWLEFATLRGGRFGQSLKLRGLSADGQRLLVTNSNEGFSYEAELYEIDSTGLHFVSGADFGGGKSLVYGVLSDNGNRCILVTKPSVQNDSWPQVYDFSVNSTGSRSDLAQNSGVIVGELDFGDASPTDSRIRPPSVDGVDAPLAIESDSTFSHFIGGVSPGRKIDYRISTRMTREPRRGGLVFTPTPWCNWIPYPWTQQDTICSCTGPQTLL